MADWSGGYVTDVEYSRSFRREQAPSQLDLACLINGVAPPDAAGPLRYCDLGCGSGYSASLLAAAAPEIEFWGIDFNPAHIAAARAFQAETGLTNLHFREHGFGDLVGSDAPDLPSFDYVALHGVYSWVGAEARRAIIRFLDTHLKPGGVVYLGYNALPAWAPELPFQRALSIHARASRERSDRAIVKAVEFAKRLRDAGARELDRPETFEKLDRLLAAGRERYLAHEYLTTEWSPMYHEDVARDMAGAKLDYVGSSDILQNFAQLCFSDEQRALCGEIGGAAAETIKDYFLHRTFRVDIFARGRRPLSPAEQRRRLRAIELGLLIPFGKVEYEFTIPLGRSRLSERLYAPIFAALQRAPMRVGDLLDLPELASLNANPVEVVGMLAGTGQAIGCSRAISDEARNRARRFNAAVAQRSLEEVEPDASFAAAAAHSGVYLGAMSIGIVAQLLAGTPCDADALAAAMARDLIRRGTTLSVGGKPLETEEAARDALRGEMAFAIEHWVPCWRHLGVI